MPPIFTVVAVLAAEDSDACSKSGMLTLVEGGLATGAACASCDGRHVGDVLVTWVVLCGGKGKVG